MKKHFLEKGVAMLGAISLLANVMLPGVQVYAEGACLEESVACIGDAGYSSITDALAAVSDNGTVILNKNVVSDAIILETDKKIILNLNGKKLSGNPTTSTIDGGATFLAIKRGGLTITGAGEMALNSDGALIYVNGGTLDIEGGSFKGGTVLYVYGTGSEANINGGSFDGTSVGNRTAIHATHYGTINIHGGDFVATVTNQSEGNNKNLKVIYAGGNDNRCDNEDGGEALIGGTINVNGGSFYGRLSKSNKGTYNIIGGEFKPTEVAGINCDYEVEGEHANVCKGGHPNSNWCYFGKMEDMLPEGYTALEKSGGVYEVKSIADAANDESNNDNVQIQGGTTVKIGGDDKSLSELNTMLEDVNNVKSGDDVSISDSDKTEIQSAGSENLVIKGALSLNLTGGAIFSRPIAIRIPGVGTASVKFKVKHGTAAYGTVGLTTDATATCNTTDGTVNEVAKQYKGTEIPTVNGWGIIYTCSASTFVAYTETTPTPAPATSGGGGSSYTPKPTITNTGVDSNTGNNVTTTSTEDTDTTIEGDSESNEEKASVVISDAAKAAYGEEQLAAYQWAYENGITTINDADKARLGDPLTRAELAKMMSQYISSVLKKSPLKTDEPSYSDVKVEELGDLVDFITKAYQYQIMGINADGSALAAFNPFGIVSRGEFATVFSRVLYGDKYNKEGDDFYTNHLAALKEAGVLSVDTPTIQEVRGWVMLMMYRSAQEKAPVAEEENTAEEGTGETVGIANPASTYCVEQGGEVVIKEDADGAQYGVCKLKDGTEVEEWEYYRANHKDEASTGAVAETGSVAETTTGSVAEAATGDAQ